MRSCTAHENVDEVDARDVASVGGDGESPGLATTESGRPPVVGLNAQTSRRLNGERG
jgi:hypothetical protein